MNIINKIKNDFKTVSDLKIKKIKINILNTVYVFYLETICDSNKIHNYILKKISFNNNLVGTIPGPNTIYINENEIEQYLTSGFAIIINKDKLIAIEVKADISRSIPSSTREPSLLGPEDAFNENYQTNMGLIKRRIKTKSYKSNELTIGRRTKTKISINYLEDVADKNLIYKIENRLTNLDIDGIIDIGNLINLLNDENKTVFPTIKRTERPDVASTAILEGKIAILMDTSPFAIILPTFLADFINPISDNYVKSINVGFLKILRLFCFFLSIVAPSLFIAITNYNQETIPANLLINFSMQQSSVPFPAIVELLILLIICDILRESDLRFPSNFGSTISILGALIIGEAAVNAGIVSPIMIIITSLTFISSLIFTELEINNAIRYYRYLFLFFASTLGLYGIFLASILFLINVIGIDIFNYPYFAPIAPFNKNYFFKTMLKGRTKKDTKRSSLIASNDLTKGDFL
jgi:spore germination protein KA